MTRLPPATASPRRPAWRSRFVCTLRPADQRRQWVLVCLTLGRCLIQRHTVAAESARQTPGFCVDLGEQRMVQDDAFKVIITAIEQNRKLCFGGCEIEKISDLDRQSQDTQELVLLIRPIKGSRYGDLECVGCRAAQRCGQLGLLHVLVRQWPGAVIRQVTLSTVAIGPVREVPANGWAYRSIECTGDVRTAGIANEPARDLGQLGIVQQMLNTPLQVLAGTRLAKPNAYWFELFF